jgi:hypothetical protein
MIHVSTRHYLTSHIIEAIPNMSGACLLALDLLRLESNLIRSFLTLILWGSLGAPDQNPQIWAIVIPNAGRILYQQSIRSSYIVFIVDSW